MVRYTVVYLVTVIVYGQSDTYKKYFWLNPKWKEVKLKYTKASWEMMNKRQSIWDVADLFDSLDYF